jgi:hypothetical protein
MPEKRSDIVDAIEQMKKEGITLEIFRNDLVFGRDCPVEAVTKWHYYLNMNAAEIVEALLADSPARLWLSRLPPLASGSEEE